jgi:hypothetical protein
LVIGDQVLFLGVFFDVFVEFAAEAGAAVVAGVYRSAAAGEPVREGCAAEVAFVRGGSRASSGRREKDVAVFATFIGAFGFWC